MGDKIGPREAALRAMRERRFKGRPIEATTMTLLAGVPPRSQRLDHQAPPRSPAAAPAANTAGQETGNMAKKRKAKRGPGRPPKAKKAAKPRKAKARAKVAPKKEPAARKPRDGTVSAQAIADFVSRPGGASMAELCAQFGVDAHPMRAKIYYVRHTLGYEVDNRDGRYHGTPPKAGATKEAAE